MSNQQGKTAIEAKEFKITMTARQAENFIRLLNDTAAFLDESRPENLATAPIIFGGIASALAADLERFDSLEGSN